MCEALYSLGLKIRCARERKGLKQNEFAQRIGYSQGWVSSVERGEVCPSIDFVRRCDAELGTKLEKGFIGKRRMGDPGERFMTPTEVSKYLGISRTQVYKLMNSEEIHWVYIDGLRRISVKECSDLKKAVNGCDWNGVVEEQERIREWLKERRSL